MSELSLKFMFSVGIRRDWELTKKSLVEADQLGIWGFLMNDHYMLEEGRGGDYIQEAWIALSYIAALTKNIRLGTCVSSIPLRPPALVAKQVATLDVISGGRTILGVGAGWGRNELEGYSVYDEAKTRVDKTVEGIDLILKLWTTNGKITHEGKYYRAIKAALEPKPLQKPHPPLMFGGRGRRMLALAGKYADICYLSHSERDPNAGDPLDKMMELALQSAKRHSRSEQISFARGSEIRGASSGKYDRDAMIEDVEQAEKSGYHIFVADFRKETDDAFLNSVTDFAKNVVPLFK